MNLGKEHGRFLREGRFIQFYIGVVEDNKDPKRRGRIKVRIQTLYHEIPLEDIPYAYPLAGLAGKEFQVPAIGKLVNILFLTNDLYAPYYIYSENYNANLQSKLKDLSDDDYINFSALLFDEATQIYVEHETLTIDQLLNKITIDSDTINLELKDNTRILNLGSRKANQDAVLGTNYFKWMDKFIDELANQFSLIGNMGAPVLKPKLTALCQEYKLKRPDFVSNNVKINNNGKVIKLKRKPETIGRKDDIDLIVPAEVEGSPCDGKGPKSKIQKNLEDTIKKQNKNSCEALDNAAPTDVTLKPLTQTDPELAQTTEEVNKVWDKDTQSKINELHPSIRDYVTRFLNSAEAEGIEIIITSGYRSLQEQADLQGSGRAAKPGKSYHNYGLAIDIALTNSSNWDRVGEIGESIGFRWGKHFRKPRPERWHFDMSMDLDTITLKKRMDNGNVTPDGYVSLYGATVPAITNEYYGQSYASNISATAPCDASKFNRKNAEKIKKNVIGSDEREKASTSEEEDNVSTASNAPLPCSKQALIDTIVSGESKDYNTTLGYDAYLPKDGIVPGSNPPKKIQPITDLTFGEIKKVQSYMITEGGGSSSAVGKYQIIDTTLNRLQKKLKLDDNVKFSQAAQDNMAGTLLSERGYDKWIKGELSDDAFQTGLAKEWASVAVPKDMIVKGKLVKAGQSYHGQNSNNMAGTTNNEMQEAMRSAKQDCA